MRPVPCLSSLNGGGEKVSPTSYSTVTSPNVGISLPNFLTLSLSPFLTKFFNLNQATTQKDLAFFGQILRKLKF